MRGTIKTNSREEGGEVAPFNLMRNGDIDIRDIAHALGDDLPFAVIADVYSVARTASMYRRQCRPNSHSRVSCCTIANRGLSRRTITRTIEIPHSVG